MDAPIDAHAAEQAVLAVLGGEPVPAVAIRHDVSEAALVAAVGVYRDAGAAAMLRLTEPREWQQAMLASPDGHGLTPAGFAQLSGELEQATADGTINGYHFLRKDGGLRLRVAPDSDRARQELARILDSLLARGDIAGWARGVYEPETYAFGGPAAMALAHRLFCADSRAALAAAGRTRHSTTGPRETAVLLASTLLRSAGLDWYEQGDVWAVIASHRPAPVLPPPERLSEAQAGMRRLLTVNAAISPAVQAEPGWPARLEAFVTAGRALADLARSGDLQRGLRAVLAHHLIFAFNRAGLSASEQAALSYLAKEVVMQPSSAPTRSPSADTDNLAAMNTSAAPTTTDDEPTRLRAELTAKLRDKGAVRTEPVASAVSTIPRHLFVPGAELAEAYADAQVFTKHARTGEALSAASQPSIVAMMLEQLGARPGDKVLEAGAGTGYNAALMGHLVGPHGHITTLDVDDDLVESARDHLAAAGVDNVTVLLRDGALGHPSGAPYDRIIATVGAGDVPDAWLDQLTPDGLLLVPLRIRGGVSRSIAFVRDGDFWQAISSEMCTFMPLRGGIADDPRQVIPLTPDGQVTIHTYRDQHADSAALAAVLEQPEHEIYTGVLFRKGDPWEWTNLYLTCALSGGLVRMPMAGPTLESGQLRPQFPWGAMAAVDDDSIAYLTLRAGQDEAGPYWEGGVIGHGPRGAQLAGEVAEHLQEWGRDYREVHPTIRLARNNNRELLTGQFVIDKAATRLAISWT